MATPNECWYDRFLDQLTAEDVDPATGQRWWQLDARRGEETRIWRVKIEDLGEVFG